MPKIIVLGTASAVPTTHQENTHFAITGHERLVMVDCVGSPLIRLEQANLDVSQLTDLILTHFHPDHVSGVPLMLMDLWLLGRTDPLHIHGLDFTIDRMEAMLDLYDWKDWPGFFPVFFHRIPETELSPVLENEEFRIFASPVHHLVPTMGLRVEFYEAGKVMAYSCDTEPCLEVQRLAASADILIHEAAGEGGGHSSPFQAGEIAAAAGADSLYLIHYFSNNHEGEMLEEAKKAFPREVGLMKDLQVFEI